METQSDVSKNRYFLHEQEKQEFNHHTQNIIHNVTMDCGDLDVMRRKVSMCQRPLRQLVVK